MAFGRWITVFRKATCETCAGNHGEVLEFAEWANLPGGLPPIHPNCWCEIVPLEEVTDDDIEEFGDAMIDLAEALALAEEIDDPFERAAMIRELANDIRGGLPIPGVSQPRLDPFDIDDLSDLVDE